MANCFGDVVDNFKLDTMVRYAGEKKSQKDRALQASLLVSEDSKDDKAVKYVRDLKTWWGNGVSTLCLIYNQTGDTLRWVDDADWFGYIGTTPYPPEIGNGQWASFLHVKKTAASSGSMAGLVYRGKDGNGRDRDFMLGWSAPWGAFYRNKAYCEVGSVGSFQSRLNNGDLYSRVSNAAYEWDANDRNARCSVRATIERGTSPLFTAYVKTDYS
ncbi:23 kDa jasmonate-induced protein-like [Triticum dicoccoides]|uniref:23 kDa jasmonate-induced protein-like n=1 Tax=Triticum dicoccoides TaxID=85692 RepID=UPI0018910232|nr:23 kDa jasmonate-induced protein-like [Triticum dicoccoides]